MLTLFSSGQVTIVNIFAGSNQGYADGTGTFAKFHDIDGVAMDGIGNMYVADQGNNRVRKITPTSIVSTLAGAVEGYADGIGTAAQFYMPWGVATDEGGNVYVADYGNNKIRKITPDGVVSTLVGSIGSSFSAPYGVAADASGNVYMTRTNDHRIWKVTPSGVVSTLAGYTGGYAEGMGATAKFFYPRRLSTDAVGNVYVADYGNYRIRKITPEGVVSTLAGSIQGSADGTGTAAKFYDLKGLATDAGGNVYVVDGGKIRKITPVGIVSTLYNCEGLICSRPEGVAIDANGNI